MIIHLKSPPLSRYAYRHRDPKNNDDMLSMTVTFTRAASGEIDGLTISNRRLRAVYAHTDSWQRTRDLDRRCGETQIEGD